jgi:hypothetical protein
MLYHPLFPWPLQLRALIIAQPWNTIIVTPTVYAFKRINSVLHWLESQSLLSEVHFLHQIVPIQFQRLHSLNEFAYRNTYINKNIFLKKIKPYIHFNILLQNTISTKKHFQNQMWTTKCQTQTSINYISISMYKNNYSTLYNIFLNIAQFYRNSSKRNYKICSLHSSYMSTTTIFYIISNHHCEEGLANS